MWSKSLQQKLLQMILLKTNSRELLISGMKKDHGSYYLSCPWQRCCFVGGYCFQLDLQYYLESQQGLLQHSHSDGMIYGYDRTSRQLNCFSKVKRNKQLNFLKARNGKGQRHIDLATMKKQLSIFLNRIIHGPISIVEMHWPLQDGYRNHWKLLSGC